MLKGKNTVKKSGDCALAECNTAKGTGYGLFKLRAGKGDNCTLLKRQTAGGKGYALPKRLTNKSDDYILFRRQTGKDANFNFFKHWAAGIIFLFCFIFMMVSYALIKADYAVAKSFSSSSAGDGGTEMYNGGGSFGTNKGSGSAITTNPETGDKFFETRPFPEKEQPEKLEIMPLYPEVRPQVPTQKSPIIVSPSED